MLHFVTSYMKQNKSRKQTLESAQYGLEISFNSLVSCFEESFRRSIQFGFKLNIHSVVHTVIHNLKCSYTVKLVLLKSNS